MSFRTALDVIRLPGPGNLWKIQRKLVYIARDGRVFVVPVGMIADGNSGPLKHAENELPGWLHDYLYRIDCEPQLTRKEADLIFYEALQAEGRSWRSATIQYLAVRLLGGPSWKQKRVL
jgi:hypothetical protein